jgi:ribosomal protein S12 methylthiotransferase accessory factor
MMESFIPRATWELLLRGTWTITWDDSDQAITYTTRDFCGTLGVRTTSEKLQPDLQQERDFQVITRLKESVWAIQTLLCLPRVWWQVLAEHPSASIVPLFFHKGSLILGPTLTRGTGLCPTCLALRMAQSFPYPDVFQSMLQGSARVNAELTSVWQASLSRDALSDFVSTHFERLQEGELASFSLAEPLPRPEWHRVLPLPGAHPFHQVTATTRQLFGIPEWESWSVDEQIKPTPSLLDNLTGPLIALSEYHPLPGEPQNLFSATALTGALDWFLRWHPDQHGGGSSFSQEQAINAASGEAIERYSGNFVPEGLLWQSEQEIARTGRPYLPQGCFFWNTTRQKASPRWPFAAIRNDRPVPWVEGESFSKPKTRVLLPAEVVYLNQPRMFGHRPHYPVNLAGMAAHRQPEQATTAALLEMIEREATMRFWYAGLPAKLIIGLPSLLQRRYQDGVPPSIRQWYLHLSTDFPVAVTAACLYDQKDEILVVGFAARAQLSDALDKAVAEAWQLHHLSLQLLDQRSDLWQEINSGRLAIPTIPFRSDRSYARAFQDDFSDMYQLAFSLQYYLDPATHPHALHRLSGEPVEYKEVAREDSELDSVVAEGVAHIERSGHGIYRVDVTTPDIRAGGFSVIRLVCPLLVGNTAPAFVPFEHPRMQQVIAERNIAPRLIPMPHA